MTGYPEQREGISASLVGAVFLGMGLMFGWGIGKDQAQDEVISWAVDTSRHCETSYRGQGFPSVSDCLEGTIAKAVAEQREERQAEAGHPNQ